MARNPYATVAAQLGVTQAVYDAAKAAVIAHLQANPAQAEIADALVQQVHAALAPPVDPVAPAAAELARLRLWNELKRELGL
jgi:hypothetical protein